MYICIGKWNSNQKWCRVENNLVQQKGDTVAGRKPKSSMVMVTSLPSHITFISSSTTHKGVLYNSKTSINNNYSSFLLKNQTLFYPATTSCSSSSRVTAVSTSLDYNTYTSSSSHQRHWIVVMDTPPKMLNSRPQIIDYYVQTILTVLGRWVCIISTLP